jgi:hypothetical protein
MSNSDVLKILYKLEDLKDIKDYFHKPDNLDKPGLYSFISKDGLSYYIGSSLKM